MLLERDSELFALRTFAEASARGESGLMVVEGPAGIGKTRLLDELRRAAADEGVRVLAARGSELEQALAFGAVRQLFEPAVSDVLLQGAAATAREVFDGPASDATGEESSFAILHGLYRLTVNVAEEAPLLLVVDDLQWCDEPSLRWLCYLVRRLDGLGVAVVCGVRRFERHAHAHLIGEIVRDPLTVALHPQPLSERAGAELIGGDEVFARACHDATGGNPLLLVELAKALRSEQVPPDAAHVAELEKIAPRAASRAVLVRLGRLSRDAAAMAHATAVLGDDAAFPLLAELAGLDDAAALTAAGQLVGAEVFADRAPTAFTHPLIRAAVYEDMPAHERSLAHEQAARLLRERGAGPGPVATQLVQAPPRGEPWVVDVLERAALTAQRAGAPASAATYLARALAEPPPPERRANVLLALAGSRPAGQSEAYLREALELTEDPALRGTATLHLSGGLLISGRPDEAVALSRRTAAELPLEADVLLAGLEAIEVTAAIFGAAPVAPERLDSYRRLPLAPGTGPKLLAAIAAYQRAYSGGSADECAALAVPALAGGDLIRSGNLLPSVMATMVVVLADREESAAVWAEMLDQAHSSGSLDFKSATSVCGGYTQLRRGELAEAEASLRDGIEELILGGTANGRTEMAAWLATIERERGNLAAARRELEVVTDPGDGSQAARYWLDSHAEQLLAEERFDAALAVARDAGQRFAGLAAIDTPARSHEALALHHLGREAEAIAAAEAELETARRWGAPSIVARALRVLGTVEREPERLRAAAEVAARSPARLELANALVAEGAALRAGRHPTEARDPLRRGLDIAAALGADALAAHARQELYAAGGRPRTTALRGVDALTPSERRVSERAAAGQTNRAIAEALFVTPKTVELHLRNAYRKLGAQTRRDLAGLFEPAPVGKP